MTLAKSPFGEKEYLDAVAQQEAFEKLPKEEQLSIKTKRQAEMRDEINKMFSKDNKIELDKEELDNSTKIHNLLIQEFGI